MAVRDDAKQDLPMLRMHLKLSTRTVNAVR